MLDNISDWLVKQYPEGYAVVIIRGMALERVGPFFKTMTEAFLWGTRYEGKWEEQETCRSDAAEERTWEDEE